MAISYPRKFPKYKEWWIFFSSVRPQVWFSNKYPLGKYVYSIYFPEYEIYRYEVRAIANCQFYKARLWAKIY